MDYEVEMIPEPVNGISASALDGYHVVVFSNPGQPVDDVTTFEHLRSFSAQGFGVIFQVKILFPYLMPSHFAVWIFVKKHIEVIYCFLVLF